MTDSGEKKRARLSTSLDMQDEWITFQMIVANIEVIDSLLLTDVTSTRVAVDVLIEGCRYPAVKDLKTKHAHELMLAFAAVKRTSERISAERLSSLIKFQTLVDLINREKLCRAPEESTDSETD